MQWLYNNGSQHIETICEAACYSDQLEVAKWLVNDIGYPCKDLLDWTVEVSCSEIFKFAVENCIWDNNLYFYIIEYDHIFKWLVEKYECPILYELEEYAVALSKFDLADSLNIKIEEQNNKK